MPKPLSIQLYTLRAEAAQDFPAVLRTVAEIGYKGVEFAGLHGRSPQDIKKLIDDLGLQVSSSHTALPTQENVNQLVETERTLGNTRLISGLGPKDFQTVDDCKRAAERFQTAAELVRPHGMTFGMHNHWWEFHTVDNGRLVYDVVLEAAPDIFSELDVYWAAYGGQDAAKVVASHKARLPVLHIKDGPLEKDAPHTAVGGGKLDISAVIGAADPTVLEWLIVELDACATDMTEAVRQSYAYLTGQGLAAGNK
ncbi:MAG: sugar phosphate isomerase/epimerase [Armatimonadetes bacterium]|nr:sugar phosphate isomerase/epimerase [Armatimonadota bacterium]